jgi:hypothetical protein
LYLTSELSWERSVVLTPVWWWQTLGRDWQWENEDQPHETKKR